MALRKRSLLSLFLGATICALFVRLFLVEDYRIISSSMFPNLLVGDLVFVSKAAFNIRFPFSSYEIVKFKRPTRSDVVAFTLPDKGIDTFVKRVVATEGDRVEIKEGVLHINGTPVNHTGVIKNQRDVAAQGEELSLEQLPEGKSYLIQLSRKKNDNYGPVDVPSNHFFAMGDNRLDSIDSRSFGPVPYSCLKGRLAKVWMSVDSAGNFRSDRIGKSIN